MVSSFTWKRFQILDTTNDTHPCEPKTRCTWNRIETPCNPRTSQQHIPERNNPKTKPQHEKREKNSLHERKRSFGDSLSKTTTRKHKNLLPAHKKPNAMQALLI